jgi:hypothetical protein
MKQLLASSRLALATGIVLAFCGFLFLYTSVSPFREYGYALIEFPFNLLLGRIGKVVALVLLALSALPPAWDACQSCVTVTIFAPCLSIVAIEEAEQHVTLSIKNTSKDELNLVFPNVCQ